MVRSPKFLFPVGLVLALGLFILAAPRTVHAVAAALVQITNTASNPVVTQSIGGQAANIVHLRCDTYMVQSSSVCLPVTSAGILNGQSYPAPYTVPSGNNLVITAIDVYPPPNAGINCSGVYAATIGIINSAEYVNFLSFQTSSDPVTTHFTYPSPSGIVMAPGTGVYSTGNIYNQTTGQLVGNCADSVVDTIDIFGYLTAN
jgi:hypothetical protein